MKLTQDQIILLLDLKESKARGAASMSCNQRTAIAEELVAMKMIKAYGFGYCITDLGMSWLEKNERKIKR